MKSGRIGWECLKLPATAGVRMRRFDAKDIFLNRRKTKLVRGAIPSLQVSKETASTPLDS